MKVIFRSNKKFAEGTLEYFHGALESLSKYLSEDAALSLSLIIDKKNIVNVSLDIQDKGKLHIYANESNENKDIAINSVIRNCASRLVKNSDKSMPGRDTLLNAGEGMDFETVDKKIVLESDLTQDLKVIEAERKISEKKATPLYGQMMNRYVNYLYLDEEINRIENQLCVLYSILETEQDTILHKDYLLLTQSIMQLEKERKALFDKKMNFENCGRVQNYVESAIDDELNLLNLKRETKIK